MSSVRLYHDDAYLRRFEAVIKAVTSHAGKPALVLDRTAFYPESGGQLGDRGQLGTWNVLDTQENDAGEILHIVDAPELPSVGTPIAGEIDWLRRRQHMAEHTAQHLLSGALLERAQAETVSARLGESALTIDVQRDRIPEAELAAAETLANDLVDDDLAIRAFFPEPAEFTALPLRRTPKVTDNIRVVAIGDFDLSPCGGTHCARTAQLGAVRITSVERYKGMTRVTFTTARRGRQELFAHEQTLKKLASELSCSPSEVSGALERLRRELEAGSAQLGDMRGQLAQLLAAQLIAAAPAEVIAQVSGDVELLRSIAAKICVEGRDAILCAPLAAASAVVLMRAPGSKLDCAKLWKQLATQLQGRGGGRPERVEGKLNAPISDWQQAVAAALRAIHHS